MTKEEYFTIQAVQKIRESFSSNITTTYGQYKLNDAMRIILREYLYECKELFDKAYIGRRVYYEPLKQGGVIIQTHCINSIAFVINLDDDTNMFVYRHEFEIL